MDFTSGSGTGSAEPTGAWATFGLALGRRLGAALMIVAFLPAAAPTTHVNVTFDEVRNATGLIRACLTRDPRFFPHCEKDPAAYKLSIPAAPGATLSFAGVIPGDYAIAALHDENRDGRMNKRLGIPREGIGFSRSPRVKFGPPAFAAVRFPVGAEPVALDIRLQYFL
jgi:uncharacterized protein (DUF2141 family)